MLVDNAIVVVESMYRRVALGDDSLTAAAKGTGQVAGAIVASTLTTCVVFLPVLFVEGLAARLIDGIAFTVVVSLLASLAVAVFLIPALGRWFLPTPVRTAGAGEAAAETMVSRSRGRARVACPRPAAAAGGGCPWGWGTGRRCHCAARGTRHGTARAVGSTAVLVANRWPAGAAGGVDGARGRRHRSPDRPGRRR